MINTKLSYTNVLELLLFIIFIYFLSVFVSNQYVCSVSYGLFDVNSSGFFNISVNDSRDLYFSKSDTLFLLSKNVDVPNYNTNVSCNWKFLLNK